MGSCTVSIRSLGIKTLSAVLAGVLLMTSGWDAVAGIEAGYINTGAGRVLVIDEPERGVQAAFGFSLESIRYEGAGAAIPGQLYVVSSNGRWRVAGMAVADRAGMRVGLPSATGNKLVFTNARGAIVGGVGWSSREVQQFAALHGLDDLLPFVALAKAEQQPGLYESIALSAMSVRGATAASAGERAAIFLGAVEMLGGAAARGLADAIMQTADEGDLDAIAGLSEALFGEAPDLAGEPLMSGVAVLDGDAVGMGDNGGVGPTKGSVAMGDNGGVGPTKGSVAMGDNGGVGPTKGSVAMGDNGGVGPTKGSVAMGDNGGVGPTKGSVAMGDNGGVGPTKGLVDPSAAVVISGSVAGLSLPLPPAPIGLSADCPGTFIYLLGE